MSTYYHFHFQITESIAGSMQEEISGAVEEDGAAASRIVIEATESEQSSPRNDAIDYRLVVFIEPFLYSFLCQSNSTLTPIAFYVHSVIGLNKFAKFNLKIVY